MAGFTPKTFAVYDDYMTPASAWESIAHLLPMDKVIWEPFYGDGKSGEHLRALGCTVIHQPEDFFEVNHGDVVVSNPPFSKKREVLERLVQLDKPFILLMPVSTINTMYCRTLFKSRQLQIIIPHKRIQFIKKIGDTYECGNACNFDCFFFCWRIGLPQDITYL